MAELPSELKVGLFDLLQQAEKERFTRSRFRELVSQYLAEREIHDDTRSEAFEYAVEAAARSARLAPDSADAEKIEIASATLRNSVSRVRDATWYPTIRDHWPSPVAHEFEMLLNVMSGRPNDSSFNIASPDTALYQLRDSFEVLIKFAAILLLRALIEADGEDGDWARRQIFRNRMSLGHWIENLRESAKRTAKQMHVPEPIRNLAAACGKHLAPAADQFSKIRNTVIGHGSRALDPGETADLVVGCTETGTLKESFRREAAHITPLFEVIRKLVDAKAFAGLVLRLEHPDGSMHSLAGFEAAKTWLHKHDHAEDKGPAFPVSTSMPDGTTLNLAPFITARICERCGRRDVIFYDTVAQLEKGGAFDLIDHARGHKARYRAFEARDIADAFANVQPAEVGLSSGESRSDQSVIEALDNARVDRNYVSPAYLRKPLWQFLESNPSGVFWLQAPAHIGKTTFVQGLASREIDKEPITERFDGVRGGRIFAYFVRKEIRTGVSGMLNTLDRLLEAALTSDQTRHKRPNYLELLHNPSPEGFVSWLNAWREFAVRKAKLLQEDAPMLIAIDGLDEADAPEASDPISSSGSEFVYRSPLILLPKPEILPAHIYLLLTSRPPSGKDEVPSFLKTYIEPLYGRVG